MTEEEIQTFEDCVEDALMREEPKKDEVDLWLDRLTPEQLAFVAWVSDAHPVDVAQEIEREIDAELPYPDVLSQRREAILAAFREEPLTAVQANQLINELSEIETKKQEVIDPTGAGWFVFENVKEVPF